jgi:hypothetical protein
VGVGGALRAAAVDFYHQSWRLAALNTALSAVVLLVVYLAVYVSPALLLLILIAGSVAAALMHCAVTLAQTDDLRFADAIEGIRLHWWRGAVLAAATLAVVWVGVIAVRFYGGTRWPLSVLVVDVLIIFGLVQLLLWPRAVHERERPLGALAAAALGDFLRRPLATIAFALALLLVNAVAVAAGILPFLTLAVAYSFLSAAHFALPRSPLREPAA